MSAVRRHSSSLRAPPPITCMRVDVAPGDLLDPLEHEPVLARERGRGSSGRSRPGPSGSALAERRAGRRDPRGHVAGREQARRRRDRTAARRRRAAAASSVQLVVGRRPQRAAALLHQPQSHHVAQQPGRAVDAALVGQVVRARPVGRAPARRARARAATRCRRTGSPRARRCSGAAAKADAVSWLATACTGRPSSPVVAEHRAERACRARPGRRRTERSAARGARSARAPSPRCARRAGRWWRRSSPR